MATLIAHHNLAPSPLALLSITGIPTFQHPFFSSSVLLTPQPPTPTSVSPLLSRPVSVGTPMSSRHPVFTLDKLTPPGGKNPEYTPPKKEGEGEEAPGLYEYYLYHNEFPSLVRPIDPGYPAPRAWPPTVIIHGNDDYDVSVDVSLHMQEALGEVKVKLFVAEGQGHLFDEGSWWEDGGPGMEAVREGLGCLGGIVGAGSG